MYGNLDTLFILYPEDRTHRVVRRRDASFKVISPNKVTYISCVMG